MPIRPANQGSYPSEEYSEPTKNRKTAPLTAETIKAGKPEFNVTIPTPTNQARLGPKRTQKYVEEVLKSFLASRSQ